MLDIWGFHEKFSLMFNPKNFTFLFFWIGIFLSFKDTSFEHGLDPNVWKII